MTIMTNHMITLLKTRILAASVDAIEDFIGEELAFATDSLLIEKIDDTIAQMPTDELLKYFERYCPEYPVSKELKTFATDEEAKEYGKNFAPYQSEKIMVAGSPVILCGTDKVYEETLWNDARELMTEIINIFVDDTSLSEELIDEHDDTITETASEIRDKVIDVFKRTTGMRFLNVNDEY